MTIAKSGDLLPEHVVVAYHERLASAARDERRRESIPRHPRIASESGRSRQDA
jgi:hypothetical protein